MNRNKQNIIHVNTGGEGNEKKGKNLDKDCYFKCEIDIRSMQNGGVRKQNGKITIRTMALQEVRWEDGQKTQSTYIGKAGHTQ